MRYKLGQDHHFEFVDGSIPWPAAVGIEAIYGVQEYFAYSDETAAGVLNAVQELVEYLNFEEPFQAVLGFSQGATLLATLLCAVKLGTLDERETMGLNQDILCAILMSGGLPFDVAALKQGKMETLDPEKHEGELNIPSAHIWAANDAQYPDQGSALRLFFADHSRRVLVHYAGHGVPTGSSAEFSRMVEMVGEVLQLASVA